MATARRIWARVRSWANTGGVCRTDTRRDGRQTLGRSSSICLGCLVPHGGQARTDDTHPYAYGVKLSQRSSRQRVVDDDELDDADDRFVGKVCRGSVLPPSCLYRRTTAMDRYAECLGFSAYTSRLARSYSALLVYQCFGMLFFLISDEPPTHCRGTRSSIRRIRRPGSEWRMSQGSEFASPSSASA